MKKYIYLSLIALFISCGKSPSTLTFSENNLGQQIDPNLEVSFSMIKNEILSKHCIGCHSDVSTASGLNKWIHIGDVEGSPFYLTVKEGSMPKNGAPLGIRELDLIRNYIQQLSPASTISIPQPVTPAPTGSKITYDQFKSTFLIPYKCLNCHSVGTEAKLSKWIDTSSPSNSLLYTRTHDGSMPIGSSDVSAKDEAFVLKYIEDFAATH
jgi:hypothetical protein